MAIAVVALVEAERLHPSSKYGVAFGWAVANAFVLHEHWPAFSAGSE
jgi:hypothetical protein